MKKVVLAVSYQPETMLEALKGFETRYGIEVVCSQEVEPLGTAGPLALAREHLDNGSGEPFFVFNSDVTCEYPLKELLAFHKSHGAEGTLLVTRVEEPSKYGVVSGVGGCGARARCGRGSPRLASTRPPPSPSRAPRWCTRARASSSTL